MTNDERISVEKEIIETERTYVNSLKTLETVYIEPLKRSGHLANVRDLTTLFSDFNVILKVNTTLLKGLEEGKLASEFVQMAAYFKTYTSYCKNYDNAVKALWQLKSDNKKFREFITKLETEAIAFKHMTFQAYLIMPVQRIPRYAMLLKELLKYTPESHPDFKSLTQALDKTKEVADYVNERIAAFINMNRVVEIHRKLVIGRRHKIKNFNIVQPHRRLILEGELTVDGTPYYVFLFNDFIMYCKKKLPKTLMLKHGGPHALGPAAEDHIYYKYKGHVLFTAAIPPLIRNIPDTVTVQNNFQVITQTSMLSIIAPNKEQKTLWLEKLKQTVHDLMTNSIAMKNKQMDVIEWFEEEMRQEQAASSAIANIDASNAHHEEAILKEQQIREEVEKQKKELEAELQRLKEEQAHKKQAEAEEFKKAMEQAMREREASLDKQEQHLQEYIKEKLAAEQERIKEQEQQIQLRLEMLRLMEEERQRQREEEDNERRLKEQEERARQEEAIRRYEELKMLMETERELEEERRKKEELERQRKQEELQRMEDAIRQMEGDVRKKEEEMAQKMREEELKNAAFEQERRAREEAIRKKEEEIRRKEEEIQRRLEEAEAKKKEDAKMLEAYAQKRQEDSKKRKDEIARLQELKEKREEERKAREKEREARLAALAAPNMRASVKSLAEDVEAKKAAKYDLSLERQAWDWIESVLGEPIGTGSSLIDNIKDGTALCKLINKIKPGTIKSFRDKPKIHFMKMENISKYLDGCKAIGLSGSQLFNTIDLAEEKDTALVLQHILVLKKAVETNKIKL